MLLSHTIRLQSQTKRGTLPIKIMWTRLGNQCLDFATWPLSHFVPLIPLTEKWNTALQANPIVKTVATTNSRSDDIDIIVVTLNDNTDAAIQTVQHLYSMTLTNFS